MNESQILERVVHIFQIFNKYNENELLAKELSLREL